MLLIIAASFSASLLELEAHHHVLDMCAAPGSKTIQMLALLEQKAEEQEESVQRKKTQRTAQPNLICDTPGIVAFSPVLDLMDRDFFGDLLADPMITSPPLNASLAKPGHSVDCSLLFSGV